MQLPREHTDEASLTHHGLEVVRLLRVGEFAMLAEQYGYAMAYGRPPVEALRDDLTKTIASAGGSALSNALPDVNVGYFAPNDVNLHAVVECYAAVVGSENAVLIELIITEARGEKHICIEDVSYFSG